MNKTLLVIVGPTAIGKTNLSVQLAKHFDCEIVSADSRQFYKEMYIGTAVPSFDELKEVPHHFIQHISIHKNYSVGDFEKDAMAVLHTLFENSDFAILVGGSGLYVNAISEGLDDFPEISAEIKNTVKERYENEGLEALQTTLKQLDPVHFEKIDIQNPHRVMRAVQVCLSSGQPYSSFITSHKKKRGFDIVKIGLTADREIIYDRINQRVELMMQQGLLEEAKGLYDHKSLNALNTVGYKEIFSYLDGDFSLEFAIEEIKKNTRRFAKRQLTWFRKDEKIMWFPYQTDPKKIIDYIKKSLK